MTDPLGSPLPAAAGAASLHPQLARAGALPVGAVQAVRLGDGPRQAGGQIRGRAQGTASAPSSMLETGVTIGPEMTSAARAPGTWLDASPRSCRTASICSSSPCM